MKRQALLAIDQGTTSSRAILFSTEGEILSVAQKELALTYPHKGWVEQKSDDIWHDTLWACHRVMAAAADENMAIAAIGISNQRETTILWDRKTGRPLYNAIVWQDRRTAGHCEDIREQHETLIRQRTGLLPDPYFSATKISWILDHVDGARARVEAGDIAFGTVDSFLIWHLTGGQAHVTDITNASRTMLFNIVKQGWDSELLEILNIPQSILPEVRENKDEFGVTAPDIFGKPYTIGGVAGDQHASLIGQACFHRGMVKSTYGTGCFALMNTGTKFVQSENKLLTTPAYKIDGVLNYALEGSIFVAGSAVQWLRDGLRVIEDAADSERLADKVADNGGVYFVPALTGLGAPYWNPEATGLITGIRRNTTREHVIRATLEAQAYQTRDLMEAMQADSGQQTKLIRVDGGLVKNEFVCGFLADMLYCDIERPQFHEATAWGAACLAGLQAGVFGSLQDLEGVWHAEKRFTPAMDEETRKTLYEGWRQAVARTML